VRALAMRLQRTASMRLLPQVVAATVAVVACPALAVLALRSSGAIASPVLLVAAGVSLSIVASQLGAAYWKRRRHPGDLLFGELLVWGWLRRRRLERLVSSAERLLGPDAATHDTGLRLDGGGRIRLLERLSRMLEARDPHTHGHSRRVARHSAVIAERMGLPGEQVARIRTAAAIHDVGKISTPIEILEKPASLTEEEYEEVKRHVAHGARMVAGLDDPELTRIVRHHHERIDGGGYPDGLAGEEIPLGARIVAVADTFDALTSDRPYRAARTHREALALLGAEAGAQLDPDAVRVFRRHYAGRRPVAVSALLVNGLRPLVQPLIGRFGNAATAAKVTAASLATVAVGSAALHQHEAVQRSSSPPPARSDAAQLASSPPARSLSSTSGGARPESGRLVERAGTGAGAGAGENVDRSPLASGAEEGVPERNGPEPLPPPARRPAEPSDEERRTPPASPSAPRPAGLTAPVERTVDTVVDTVQSLPTADATAPVVREVESVAPKPSDLGLDGS